MMQLLGLFQNNRFKDWIQSIIHLHLNNFLGKVERAGFLATHVGQESGPFGLSGPIPWSRIALICGIYSQTAHFFS
jgi:hypothetical protein